MNREPDAFRHAMIRDYSVDQRGIGLRVERFDAGRRLETIDERLARRQDLGCHVTLGHHHLQSMLFVQRGHLPKAVTRSP